MIRQNFNAGWQVEKGSKDSRMNSFLGKTEIQTVHLPYDPMIHERRDSDTPNGAQTGFYPGGEYIFQKHFTAPQEWNGKPVSLAFEGVYQTALVYVNGFLACKNVNGYADFIVPLTPFVKYGADNLVKVIADNSLEPNSRWYTGSGIYRNVKLLVGNRVFIPCDGVKITTREANPDSAWIDVVATIKSASTVTERVIVTSCVRNKLGEVVQDRQKVILFPGEETTVSFQYCISSPELWSVECPALYSSIVKILEGESVLDLSEDFFGIRTVTVDAKHGVRINGEAVKLRGACIHHDNGILGAATFDAAEEYRCRRLKEAGFNAIRSAHHPISRSMLEACDRNGMLVMDELTDVWNIRKNPYDYALNFANDWEQTVEKIIAKDYNHPCVILYCIGNEISEAGTESGAVTNRAICNKFHSLDPTRYTTNALNGLMAAGYRLREIMKDVATHFAAQPQRAGRNGSGSNALNSFMSLMAGEKGDYFSTHPLLTEALSGCSDSCDVIGLNYLTGRHVLEREIHPHKTVLGTETYPADIVRLWKIVSENPHVIGDFTWAGYDYLGEAGCGIFHYDGGENFSSIFPERTAYIGDLDLIGYRRPISYLREIVYGLRKEPYIAVIRMNRMGQACSKTPWMFKDNIASWTWPGYEGQSASVDIYSASEEVELFLNGNSLGRQHVEDYTATYMVPYQPGELKAVGYTNGQTDGESILCSANNVSIVVDVDKQELTADGEDLAFCKIHFADANGQDDLFAVHPLSVTVEGAGALEAFGNAAPCSTEEYDSSESQTYDGYCLAVIRAKVTPGIINVKITSGEEIREVVLYSR